MTGPADETVAAVAQALGIAPRACRKILVEEAATAAEAEEALRRIRRHRAYLAGTIRSPGAFFRGVLRRVQDDGAVSRPAAPPPLPKEPANKNAQPASPLGRAYLRAYHLLAEGADPATVATVLHRDFPDASADFLAHTLSWATSLRGPDRSQPS